MNAQEHGHFSKELKIDCVLPIDLFWTTELFHFSFIFSIQFAEHKLQCLLCGTFHRDETRFVRHYAGNHTIYGHNRQCITCSQHFLSRRNLARHIRGGKCPGHAVLYCQANGGLYYRGSVAQGLRDDCRIYLRRPNNENALVSTERAVNCARLVPIEQPKEIYALTELPLPNAAGAKPVTLIRDFCPKAPVWRCEPVPIISAVKPISLEHLEQLLAVVKDEKTDAIDVGVAETVEEEDIDAINDGGKK